MITKIALIAAILMSGFLGRGAMAQEKVKGEKAAGRTVTVFVENDRVKVYEGRFGPGEKSPQMSDRPPRVEFALTDAQMRHYYPDGKTEDVTWKAGDVKWSDRATYQQENVGKTEFRIRVVQIK
jgi:hypothetical protein